MALPRNPPPPATELPPGPLTRNRERALAADPRSAPRVSWERFRERFRRSFRQGEHVTILGPTRSGKTLLASEVADCRGYILFLATKPRDPLIAALRRRGYIVSDRLEFRRDPETGELLDRRVVYWPRPVQAHGGKGLRELRAEQAAAVRRALEYVYRVGRWCVVADETVWLADDLGLADELTMLLYQGRTLEVSMICCAQRPAWVPRACYSQADHIFLFQTSDREDLKRLGDVGGANVDRIRALVPTLNTRRHEFLYVGTRTGVLLRSQVERGHIRPERPAHDGRQGKVLPASLRP